MFFWCSVAMMAATVPPELDEAEALVPAYKCAEAKAALGRPRAVGRACRS
jgi:hypothetical protein